MQFVPAICGDSELLSLGPPTLGLPLLFFMCFGVALRPGRGDISTHAPVTIHAAVLRRSLPDSAGWRGARCAPVRGFRLRAPATAWPRG
ncbi:MAG: hypothetical protein KGJ55_09220 [Gammaproteobacteria bacterium]|nr:hypothetical protein [Gammaproteobacteria bacterium]